MPMTMLEYERSILFLERLWDHLETVVAALHSSDEQPQLTRVATVRIWMCKARLREIVSGRSDREHKVESLLASRATKIAREVLDLLELLNDQTAEVTIGILYHAQEVVSDGLHDVRSLRARSENVQALRVS